MGDLTQPGDTELTRTPRGPSSTARVRVSMISAAFEAEYAAAPGAAARPPMDATLTTDPPRTANEGAYLSVSARGAST